MDKSQALMRLLDVQKEKKKTEETLHMLSLLEKELKKFLGLSVEKEGREYLSREESEKIRSKIIAAVKHVHDRGISWVAASLIVSMVNRDLPEDQTPQIERQLRALAAMEDSPITHNGQRGRGSFYAWKEK